MNPILIIPSYEQGRGGGHLARCTALAQELRSMGREVILYALADGEEDLKPVRFDFIVLDLFRTSQSEFLKWRSLAPVIGIDEGGAFRSRFDFLIDILPNVEKSAPNICDPALLRLPKTRRPSWEAGGGSIKALVSFGAEDAAGLTLPAAKALAAVSGELFDVTAAFGALNRTPHEERMAAGEAYGFRVVENVTDLAERLAEYDLVVTHFGLTAFESLYARVPALLVAPSAYHERLTRSTGLPQAGRGRRGAQHAARILSVDGIADITERCRAAADRYGINGGADPAVADPHHPKNLAGLLNTIELHAPSCPVCGSTVPSRALARFTDRTYRFCPSCGVAYMSRLSAPPIEYAKDYFFTDYKRQYGKTYLEDFPSLKAAAKTRLSHIRAFLNPLKKEEKPRILDIGCAYGAFLQAASEEGFALMGIEPAEDAVSYVNDTLGIPCIQGNFPLFDEKQAASLQQCDALSFWYVIEHFEDAGAALAEANRLLKKGGVLGFSTPSLTGISARKSLKTFLKNSPADHYTVWNPRKIRKTLSRFGFTLKKIVITGHHPERFPIVGTYATKKHSTARRGALYQCLLFLSRLFGWGDTFEIYAVKTRDI